MLAIASLSLKIFTKSIFYGILCDGAVTLLFLLTPLPSKPFGFHAGVIGLLFNFLAIYLHHKFHKRAEHE